MSTLLAKDQQVIVALRTRPFLASEHPPPQLALDDQQPPSTAVENDFGPPVAEEESERTRGVSVQGEETMVVHLPVKKWNGVQVQDKSFDVDFAFGPDRSTEEVFDSLIVQQGVLEMVLDGGVGLILAYGQTGSGKTHTIQGINDLLSRTLFPTAQSFAATHFPTSALPAEEVFEFELEAYEVLGRDAWDLLGREEGRERGNKVDFQEDMHQQIQTTTSVHPVPDPSSLLFLLSNAFASRRTSATTKNASSSRSHALLTLLVTNRLFPHAKKGRLMVVDLAGSERAADRVGNDRERVEEGRLINESLMGLKDCVRARSKVDAYRARGEFTHVPYRSSKLTLALKPVFDVESTQSAKLVIVGHASPHPQDASHSLNTLSYCTPFRVTPTKLADPAIPKPFSWTHEEFKSWVAKESKKIDPDRLAPNGETGLMMTALTEKDFIDRCLGAVRQGQTLAPKGAKAFYLHLWKTTFDAKTKSLPHLLHGRLVARDPTAWTHFELLDFFDEEFPAVDGERAFPDPIRGKDVMEMGEATFSSRCISAPHDPSKPVSPTLALKIRNRLWSLRIEERKGGKDVMKRKKRNSGDAAFAVTLERSRELEVNE